MSCIDVTVMDDRQRRTGEEDIKNQRDRQNTQSRLSNALRFSVNIFLLVHDWRMTLLRSVVQRLTLPAELSGRLTHQAAELTQLERICLH